MNNLQRNRDSLALLAAGLFGFRASRRKVSKANLFSLQLQTLKILETER